MLTIYRTGLTLTSGGPLEPAEGSYNISVNLVNDDTYSDYVISMYVGYRIKGIQKNKRIEKDSNENYLIPAEAFAQAGSLFISFLLENKDATQGMMTNALSFNIKDTPYNNIVLSDDPTWKEEVKAWVEELYAGINGGITDEQIQNVVTEYLTENPIEIPSEYVTEDELNAKGYLTEHQSLDHKQDTLVSGTNIKTINGETLLGSGDLKFTSGGSSSESGTFELIADVTITEEVTDFEISTDLNGNSFEIEEFILCVLPFSSPTNTANTRAWVGLTLNQDGTSVYKERSLAFTTFRTYNQEKYIYASSDTTKDLYSICCMYCKRSAENVYEAYSSEAATSGVDTITTLEKAISKIGAVAGGGSQSFCNVNGTITAIKLQNNWNATVLGVGTRIMLAIKR